MCSGVWIGALRLSLERLHDRVESYFDRFIVMEDWGNFPVDLEEFVHGHLCDADRIFNGKNDVFGNFDKLTHESEIYSVPLHYFWKQRPKADCAALESVELTRAAGHGWRQLRCATNITYNEA
jgi:hypothetical protein